MKRHHPRDGAEPPQTFRLRPVARAILGICLTATAFSGHALPTGAEISAGGGVIGHAGDTLTIHQTSPRLAINWQSFGIGTAESVVFRQPDAGAIALNRVLGQDPSAILGRLSANGQVFVLNPNGVLFGPGAQVDVGGIVASTLGLSDADFLAGRYTFTNGGSAGSVVNRGTIRAADGGYVALIAPQVTNEGAIAARLGTVALGAGDQVTLMLAGNSLVGFAVDQAAVAALVANRQLIQADGGAVVLSARAKDALLATVVNNEGIVEARSVSVRNGVIRLEGGASGVVAVGGRLDASGANAGETGGSVTITGDKVGLASGALVDASGHAGGGTVLVGGDYQGRNPEVRNASRSYVGPDAIVRADATHNGEGGRVIVWADGATQFYGAISARGGPGGGNGGFVETSGKVTLQSTGSVDASAANGRAGQWLLDPNNITIQTAGANTNVTAGPNFTTTNDSAIVTTGSILAALNAGTSVTVATGSAGANTQPGNITVANAIAKTAGGNAALTLTAINNIVFNAGANVSSTSNQLNLTLNAGGTITSPVAINTNGGLLTYNAAGAATQSGVISGAGSVVKNGAGTLTLSGANSYSGATSINAGALQLGAANRIANTSAVTVASGATFNLNNFAETVGSIAGAGTIALGTGTLTAGGNNTSTTFSGVATGSGGLTKTGTGTLTLSGANAYTGATAVNAGVLRVQSNTALGTVAGTTTVASGAALELSGSGLAIAELLTLTGTGVGGAGALRNLANANTLTGAITLGAGGARINSDGGTLTISGAGNITGATRPLRVGGAGNTTISKAIATTSGTLTKDGAGTLTLSGANAYTGATAVNAGVLRVQSNTALGTVAGTTTVAAGAALELSGSGLAIAEPLTLNGTGVGGGGALRNLASANTMTGAIALGATGARINSDAGTLTISGAGNITGNTRPLTVGGAGNTTISKIIATTSGTLTKDGTGTLTLSGANTYTGATNVNAGTLIATSANALGTTANGTTVNAGATLELDGTLTYAEPVALNNATLAWAVGNPTLNGAVALTGGNTITGAAGTFTLGGVVSGAGGFDKAGAGTLVVSGNNTYTGLTQVSAGALQVSSSSGLGSTAGATHVGGNARLIVNGVAIGAEPVILDGPGLFGAGAITSNGVASLAGPITLAADSVIAPNAGSALSLTGPVDGAFGLTTGGLGSLGLNGTVGGTAPLAFLTTGATGTTQINAGLVRTSGSQSYNNPAAIGAGVTLQSTGADLAAAAPVTATAGVLALSAAGNVSFANAANDFGTAGIAAGGDATLVDANGIVLAASTVGGNLDLTANGAIGQTGAIGVAGTSDVSAGPGPIALTGANDFGGDLLLATTGPAQVNDVNALALGAASVGTLTATAGGGVTLNGTVTATGAGSSIVLAAPTFINNAGAAALDSGAGRWLVYSTDPATNAFGGLASGNQALWNRAYPAVVTEPGNRYVFAIQPTLAFTSTDVAKTYGQDATAVVAGALAVTGFVDAAIYGGVFTQDTAANTYSGAPVVTSPGSPASAPVAGSPYPIAVDVSGITPTTGYGKAGFSTGVLTVNAAPLTITADNQSKVYGDADPTLTATYTGLQNGETPAVVTGLSLFAPTGAAATVSWSPHAIVPSGASAVNYTISYVDGLLTVTPRPLTIAADPQTKVYGEPDPALTYAVGGGGLVYGDVLTGALTRVSGETVAAGPYAILQGTLTNAANPNYAIAYTGNVLAITPATLTYLANAATVLQGAPFPAFTGAVLGFRGTDTQANATTGTLAFATTAASNSPGTYPIDGFGLVANFGNYVFAQAPSNATALTIEPRGNPVPPVELPQAYTGALATAAQSESTCAELQADGQIETLCGAQQNFRSSEQVNLVPGWRRVIELGRAALTVEGEGMHTP